MGSTLLSCTNVDGNQQKIETVQVIEQRDTDRSAKLSCGTTSLHSIKESHAQETIEGELMIMGDIDAPPTIDPNKPVPFVSLQTFPSFINTPKKKSIEGKFSAANQHINF